MWRGLSLYFILDRGLKGLRVYDITSVVKHCSIAKTCCLPHLFGTTTFFPGLKLNIAFWSTRIDRSRVRSSLRLCPVFVTFIFVGVLSGSDHTNGGMAVKLVQSPGPISNGAESCTQRSVNDDFGEQSVIGSAAAAVSVCSSENARGAKEKGENDRNYLN